MQQDQLDNIIDQDGCPQCGSSDIKSIKYTWWGGLIGPKLLHHTKCNSCKFLYNSKSRKSNTNGIILYFVITFVIVFAIFFGLRMSMG
jgi:hypothetical protein